MTTDLPFGLKNGDTVRTVLLGVVSNVTATGYDLVAPGHALHVEPGAPFVEISRITVPAPPPLPTTPGMYVSANFATRLDESPPIFLLSASGGWSVVGRGDPAPDLEERILRILVRQGLVRLAGVA